MSVEILIGDALATLRDMPDQSAHCCVTSPPYFGLRDYGVEGQMGLEATPDAFVAGMVAVFAEVRRVLRDDGTLWLNIGDSYATQGGKDKTPHMGAIFADRARGQNVISRGKRLPRGEGRWGGGNNAAGGDLKPKDLIGIPWLLAFALRADGWYLRQDIIWSKPNPMPESVTDRCTKAHEYLFLLSKGPRYRFDAKAIAEPLASSSIARLAQDVDSQHGSDRVPGKTNGRMKAVYTKSYTGVATKDYEAAGAQDPSATKARIVEKIISGEMTTRNKRSVWEVTTQPFSEAHFATFPPDLIEPCILAGCPAFTCSACGTVLDSRYGKASSRTTGEADAALQMVRDASDAGPTESGAELLQQGVRVEAHGQASQDDQRALHDVQGLRGDIPPGTPEREQGRLRDGTPPSDGGPSGASSQAERGCAPSGRRSTEQRGRKSGTADKAGPRQTAEGEDRHDPLSALQREHPDFSTCPSCGANLTRLGAIVPGTVLDCFGGAGTTGLVADRLQRNATLIELNPEYAAIARRRIESDRGGLLDAMEAAA